EPAVPVSVRLALPSRPRPPVPPKTPENVVARLPRIDRLELESVGPIVTVPPPESEPTAAVTPPSPTTRLAPAATVTSVALVGLRTGSAVELPASSVPALTVVEPP